MDGNTQYKTVDLKKNLMFKYMFGNDKELLKIFIENIIPDYTVNGQITLIRTELDTTSSAEINRTVDLLIKVGNNDYIDIEMNRKYFPWLVYRNFSYITKTYNRYLNIKNNNNYGRFYLINLNNFKVDLNNENVYVYGKNLTNIYIKYLQIINIDIDKYYKSFYNGDERLKTRLIAMLNAKNKEELSYILGNSINKERKEKIMHNYSIYDSEEVMDKSDINRIFNKAYDDAIHKEAIHYGLTEGRKKGIQIGIKEGRKEGIKEGKFVEKNNNIINCLKNGIDIKLVSKIFDKSISEIEEIQNNII